MGLLPLPSAPDGDDARCPDRAAVSGPTETAVRARLALVEQRDTELGSLVLVDASGALEQAREVDARRERGLPARPLEGVCFVVKDNVDVAGQVTSCGSRAHDGRPADDDAPVVARLREAGAVLLGRANMDELAMGASTATSAFGATRNPWDTRRSPGGSSGGCAAAVAAGFVDLAVGTDTGGSIREPASQCGVVGLAPSPFLVSTDGVQGFAPTFDRVGPLAADIGTARTAYAVMAGLDLDGSPVVAGMRVGVVTELSVSAEPGRAGNQSGVRERLDAAVGALLAAGVEVVEVSVPEAARALDPYLSLTSAECVPLLERWAERPTAGRELVRRVELGRGLREHSREVLDEAARARRRLRDQVRQALSRCDALLSPTMPTTAPLLAPAGPDTADVADPMTAPYTDCWTVVANLAGVPALSVPAGTSSDDGMPVGVMLAARHGAEATLLSLGEVVERSTGELERSA